MLRKVLFLEKLNSNICCIHIQTVLCHLKYSPRNSNFSTSWLKEFSCSLSKTGLHINFILRWLHQNFTQRPQLYTEMNILNKFHSVSLLWLKYFTVCDSHCFSTCNCTSTFYMYMINMASVLKYVYIYRDIFARGGVDSLLNLPYYLSLP